MQTILAVLDMFIKHFKEVYIAVGIILLIFGLVNFSTNVYHKDIKKLQKATKMLSKNKESYLFVTELPYTYRYMWQLYATGNNIWPRDAFRFVKGKQRRYGIVVSAVSVLFCLIMVAGSVVKESIDPWLICIGVSFAVFFGACLVIIKLKENSQAKKASIVLAKFVCCMDAVFGKNCGQVQALGKIDEKSTDEIIEKIKFLRENGLPCANAQKIASLLSAEKLSMPRTIEQQKKLNAALNGLVQVMSYTLKNQN